MGERLKKYRESKADLREDENDAWEEELDQ